MSLYVIVIVIVVSLLLSLSHYNIVSIVYNIAVCLILGCLSSPSSPTCHEPASILRREEPEKVVDVSLESAANQKDFLCCLPVPFQSDIKASKYRICKICLICIIWIFKSKLHLEFAVEQLIDISVGFGDQFGHDLLQRRCNTTTYHEIVPEPIYRL
jgi:hypothetical protein